MGIVLYSLQKYGDIISHLIFILVSGGKKVDITVLICQRGWDLEARGSALAPELGSLTSLLFSLS